MAPTPQPAATAATDTALILGGTSGIGLAVARQLLAADIHVILVGKNEHKINKARQICKCEKALVIWQADLSCPKSWPSVIEKIDALGPEVRLRFVVNSAGVFVPKPFLEHTSEDYKVRHHALLLFPALAHACVRTCFAGH